MAKIFNLFPYKKFKSDWLYYTLFILLAAVAIFGFVAWKPAFFFPSTPEELRLVRIDTSTAFALSYWFQHGVQFGKDIIFAYGPLGFIKYAKYHPASFHWMITGQIFLYLTFITGAWLLIRNVKNKRFLVLMGAFLCSLLFVFQLGAFLPSVNMKYLTDAFLQSFLVLLVVNYYFVDADANSISTILLAVASALVALIKVSLLFLAVVCIFFITVTDIFDKKKFPTIATIFSVSFFALWYAAGQQLPNIPDYFLSSLQLMSGYTEAMSYGAPVRANLFCEIVLYILLACILQTLLCLKLQPYRIPFNLIPFTLFAAFIFLIFKHSFIRHDGHALEAFYMLFFFLYIILALWNDFFKNNLPKILFRAYLGVFIIFTVFILIHYIGPSRNRIPTLAQMKQSAAIPYNVMNVVHLVKKGTQTYTESLYAEKEAIRLASGLPSINETVDLYPDNIAIVTALELKYKPRPVAISHGAYSPFLALKDAEYLRGSSAPEKILFKVETIDHRYPSIDDGVSWQELWTRYAFERNAGDYLLLSRMHVPKKYTVEKIDHFDIPFGRWIDLADSGSALIWAEIDMKQTTAGKLINFIYKLPEVKITVKLKNSTVKEYRIIPGMLSSGFLLSPLVEENRQFKDIMTNKQKHIIEDAKVQAVMFSVDNWWFTQSSNSVFYTNNFQMRISRLDW